MKACSTVRSRSLAVGLGAVVLLLAGCAGMTGGKVPVQLSGSQEVPPVTGSGSGTADILVSPSKCQTAASGSWCTAVTGTVKTSGVSGTAAHIHQGKAGQNGPVIITLTKTADDTWVVPPFTFLTDAQYISYVDGDLYVNVHSAAN